MRKSDIQQLREIYLIQGEYISLTIYTKKQDGTTIDTSRLTKKLKVSPYGQREYVLSEIEGRQVDGDKITFEIPSSETVNWQGKLEYIIEVTYANGNKNMGLGYITVL